MSAAAPGSGRERITIAILALGGQGGGVLADWILDVANRNGYIAQGTSVPGVAQRTGSTVYYIEMLRKAPAGANRPKPVLAMMPVPGDVDVVIASELMEAGRAILRGFVTEDRTTLIGSSHRIYAISEKAALANGIGSSERILAAAERRARRFIGFDMAEACDRAGAVISSVMLGALAASNSLPFTRSAFEEAIKTSGKAVDANLRGFGEGHDSALRKQEEEAALDAPPEPASDAGRALLERIQSSLPQEAWNAATFGVAKLMDYQDAAYAGLYLDRLSMLDAAELGAGRSALIEPAARHLALWMAYEDTIRVADLKIRATRLDRIRGEAKLERGQVLKLTEYMHPRYQEVCETLPAGIGQAMLRSRRMRKLLAPLFSKGRHVSTTSFGWFFVLRCVAAGRRWRRRTLRYRIETVRIEAWLKLVKQTSRADVEAAIELVASQQLIKGYGDTFERGLERFEMIMAAGRDGLGTPGIASHIAELRRAALADEKGVALKAMLRPTAPAGADAA